MRIDFSTLRDQTTRAGFVMTDYTTAEQDFIAAMGRKSGAVAPTDFELLLFRLRDPVEGLIIGAAFCLAIYAVARYGPGWKIKALGLWYSLRTPPKM